MCKLKDNRTLSNLENPGNRQALDSQVRRTGTKILLPRDSNKNQYFEQQQTGPASSYFQPRPPNYPSWISNYRLDKT